MSVLNSCHRAHGAGYRHGSRTGCLKGTRGSVLDEIEQWTEDFEASPIFWLNGLAGTGKSTIAQTIAERLFADGRLGASFFCSRGVEDRSNLQLIFPTLAFQLAQQYPEFRSSLIPLLQSNPDITHESLLDQMEKFLVEPLQSAGISTVIIIDALDECKDEDPESAILLVLGQSVSGISGVKFFITSRPEKHIMTGFRCPLLEGLTDVFVLHHVEPSIVDEDIRRLLKHELSKLAHRNGGMAGWPTDEELSSLCRRAGGFFVYAVATLNFLDHKFHDPSDRLNVIMKSPEDTAYEGKAKLKVYNSLDSLYTSILQAVFIEQDPNDDTIVRSVLSAVVLPANPLSLSAIATLTGFRYNQVQRLLELIQSLLILPEDPRDPIQPFHKSFPDFITDPTRCSDPWFHISPDHHIELALQCFELMGKLLKKNMCSIPDYVLNSEVEDLPKRVEESGIHGVLEYACMPWHKHLVVTKHHTVDVISALQNFLEGRFTLWLEVLSILGAVGGAAHALIATTKWLNEVGQINSLLSCLTLTKSQIQEPTNTNILLDTAADCLRFVTEFFEVISQSAPHIYHSALLLTPQSSIVWKLYNQQIYSLARVVIGMPASWDSCTATARTMDKVHHAVWSPCGQFIATGFLGMVLVQDSNTLERLSTLKPPNSLSNYLPVSLTFSPDGNLLACAYKT